MGSSTPFHGIDFIPSSLSPKADPKRITVHCQLNYSLIFHSVNLFHLLLFSSFDSIITGKYIYIYIYFIRSYIFIAFPIPWIFIALKISFQLFVLSVLLQYYPSFTRMGENRYCHYTITFEFYIRSLFICFQRSSYRFTRHLIPIYFLMFIVNLFKINKIKMCRILKDFIPNCRFGTY